MSESTTFDAPVTPDVSGVTDLNPEMIHQLKARLKDTSNIHDIWADPILVNGGTI